MLISAPALTLFSIFGIFGSSDTPDTNYCYAFWASHGAYWQDVCYPTKKECKKSLKEHFEMGLSANTKKCYRQEYTDAYCISVPSGYFRQTDDFETVVPIYASVCTKKYEDCAKYERFSIDSDKCEKANVPTRESEGRYLSPQKELDGILTRNTELYKPTEFIKPIECTKYTAIPNQPVAFETLGLDWNRTKNWGAFLDVYGNLRANKPSCRLIKPNSSEYDKYRK